MPRNSSGVYTLPQSPFAPGTTISSAAVNSDFSDIASALTGSIAANGTTPITGTLRFQPGSSTTPSFGFTSDLTSGFFLSGVGIPGITAAGGTSGILIDSTHVGTGKDGNALTYLNGAVITPVGGKIDFAGSTAPSGWFLCYGQAISRTSYPELFTVIGTTYGSGDGSTTFNLPDDRGRASFGQDNMGGTAANRITVAGKNFDGTILGNTGGVQNITLTLTNLPSVSISVDIPAGQGSHTHALSGSFYAQIGGTSIGQGGLPAGLASPGIGSAALPDMTGNASLAGSSTPVGTLSNAIIYNKLIFAGRP